MPLEKIFSKHRQLGWITLLPTSIVFCYVFYFFMQFYDNISRYHYRDGFNFDSSIQREHLIIGLIFLIIFSGVLSGAISSIIYIINGWKKNEKWMRIGDNFRMYSWILVAIMGLGFVALFSALIMKELS